MPHRRTRPSAHPPSPSGAPPKRQRARYPGLTVSVFPSLRDLWGGGGGFGLGGWVAVVAVALVVGLAVFLAQGGGVLTGTETGRYSGGRGDFVECRYLTATGRITERRLLTEGSGGACVPLRQF